MPVRWPAIDGKGDGAWGCYESHRTLLRFCREKRLGAVLVLEDDAVFTPDFTPKTADFVAEMPCDWELAFLGGEFMGSRPQRVNARVWRPFGVHRTHAYAVHSRGFGPLLDWIDKPRESRNPHIDWQYSELIARGGIATYAPRQWCVGQDLGASDIDHSAHHTTIRFYNHAHGPLPTRAELRKELYFAIVADELDRPWITSLIATLGVDVKNLAVVDQVPEAIALHRDDAAEQRTRPIGIISMNQLSEVGAVCGGSLRLIALGDTPITGAPLLVLDRATMKENPRRSIWQLASYLGVSTHAQRLQKAIAMLRG